MAMYDPKLSTMLPKALNGEVPLMSQVKDEKSGPVIDKAKTIRAFNMQITIHMENNVRIAK